jgi:hypothetical protein
MTFSDELPIRRPLTEDTKKVCEILGLDPDTPDDEVDKAYIAMMAEWHTSPDLTKQKLKELTEVYHRVVFHRDHRIKNDRSSVQSDAIYAKKNPMVDISAQSHGQSSNAIWNPNAASNWSLIFTPAFGSYLNALNWRTLGEPDRAQSAMVWFYCSLGLLFVYIFMGVFIADKKVVDGASRVLAFLYLLIWYFSAGRAQAKYVKGKFGSDYPRRSWSKPLLIGVAAIVGYFMLAFVIGFIIGIM